MKKSELKEIIKEELLKEYFDAWKYSKPLAHIINKVASKAEDELSNAIDIRTAGFQDGKKQIEKARLEVLKGVENYFDKLNIVILTFLRG